MLQQAKSQPYYLVEPPQEFDEEGKELGPDAQVWKTYVREADRVDEELVDGWNKSMDVNLIFAALFSAISTAFVIESYKSLKPDPADVSAQTLLVISHTLSSLVNTSQPATSAPIQVEEAAPFRASLAAICVNVLWFLSLSLSVAVSLISMLAKEWCLEFMSGRTGPPGTQARRRQRRWDGLESWRMKEVLILLPSLIHLSLLLFAIGLCVFLWDVHYGVAIPVVFVTTLAAGTYFACTILPFIDNYCPYGTVLSRLYKQFSGEYSQSVRDSGKQDETTGRALHWMIVNCETPRSVDVALQSLAGAEEGLPRTMLERCDAWTLIRQRAESIHPTAGNADRVNSLYKRALDCHFKITTFLDKSDPSNHNYQRIVPLVLGMQACINSVIYKVLERLRPLDRNRSIFEQCTVIGPRLLYFDCGIFLVGYDEPEGPSPYEYGYMHAERSEALGKDIIQILAQHMTRKVEIDPTVQCALSACMLLLLSFEMVTNPSAAVGYIQRLVRASESRLGDKLSTEDTHTRTEKFTATATYENQATFALFLGAIAIANTDCFVKESPCLHSRTGSIPSTHPNDQIEKVLEFGWQYLISTIYPGTTSFNTFHYLIHGLLHLLAEANTYNLTTEDCIFLWDLLKDGGFLFGHSSEEDECCLAHHVKAITSALTPLPNLDTLSFPLVKCLSMLPKIVYGNEYLQPTPESYSLTVKVLCWESKAEDVTGLIHLLLRFPFPTASDQLVDLFSTSGIIHELFKLLESTGEFRQAFAVAQIWLLFRMLLQASVCESDTMNKLEHMLLRYPGLENDLTKLEAVSEDLESRMLNILHHNRLEGGFGPHQITYLYRVLECMLQTRCMPLLEEAHEDLKKVPQCLRGINSFVDLEAGAAGPPNDSNAAPSNLESTISPGATPDPNGPNACVE
ncbi:Phenylalanine--tRNA ligase beta subunit [Rhizoctonia solani]|uniref:Phenylalanine--tRNA ligase beta subunit n=1 Tax=Rhizoctonia solani TaxID=456999 RepID=A0A0K6GAR7_9AGAM|nr:Phenylalanine--tRNA ligase beta subunit [Rhizoctonia solani]